MQAVPLGMASRIPAALLLATGLAACEQPPPAKDAGSTAASVVLVDGEELCTVDDSSTCALAMGDVLVGQSRNVYVQVSPFQDMSAAVLDEGSDPAFRLFPDDSGLDRVVRVNFTPTAVGDVLAVLVLPAGAGEARVTVGGRGIVVEAGADAEP